MYHKYAAEVSEKEQYWKVLSPHNPTYFWGNCLIMKQAPGPGDFDNWIGLYQSEFKDHKLFQAIAWDQAARGEIEPFLDSGFGYIDDRVLVLGKPIMPQNINEDLEIRHLQSDTDWNQFASVRELGQQFTERFVNSQAKAFRNLTDQGVARRYGAFEGGRLLGDIGIYYDDQQVRFHNVATNLQHRRKGVCKTIMHRILVDLTEDFPDHEVVIVAEDESLAFQIYQSMGFEPREQTYQLQWFDRAHFCN